MNIGKPEEERGLKNDEPNHGVIHHGIDVDDY